MAKIASMNPPSPFSKRRAFSLIFVLAGVFLALFAAADSDTLSRGNARQADAGVGGSNAPSAGVQESWVARYNPGYPGANAYALAVDSSGNVYVTGYGAGMGNDLDYATVKYNSAGQQQWVAPYDGPGHGHDYAQAIALDASGNVYVTGQSTGTGGLNDYDYATVKYNSAGQQQWVARYDGPGHYEDDASAIAVDNSGNVYVTGSSYGAGTGNFKDFATIKYNSAGQEQWVARYNGPSNGPDEATAIAIDGAGNVYVTGFSKQSPTGVATDYVTIKYNSGGQQQWVVRYNGPSNSQDNARAIAVDWLGNVYVTGESGGKGLDYATIKYNSAGQQLWVARYNGPANKEDSARAIAIDPSGNVYVTGYSLGLGTCQFSCSDYATVKYNASGVQQWVARYDGPGHDQDIARAIALDGLGNVYVTGWSYGVGTNVDFATIKYNSAGQEEWVARHNGRNNGVDEAFAIAVDGPGNVYVTGSEYAAGYATIKYVQAGTPTPTPTPKAVQVTVQTNPTGLAFSVDDTAYTTKRTFSWAPDSTHTIATTSPQNGATGVRYVWMNWTGGGAISHTVAAATNKTYTANFRTQYQLTMKHGTGGKVSPSSGWRNSGATVSISASPNEGYSFDNWAGSGTGSYSGTNNPSSILMSGPITETATFGQN